MKLEVLRFSSQKRDTLGLLFDITDGRRFLCFTLEDEDRDEKVMHETRIPAGTSCASRNGVDTTPDTPKGLRTFTKE